MKILIHNSQKGYQLQHVSGLGQRVKCPKHCDLDNNQDEDIEVDYFK